MVIRFCFLFLFRFQLILLLVDKYSTELKFKNKMIVIK